ncbi:GNAT family N-acetyltransferase [Siphonobacter sp. SORGH_AS_0500]|uniref:GNAT family N-acetyltransferase n=1 Tax=Siphonobacter sp. SORGH_AS_0500 TaxID=1864824 RepID=UPI00286198F1|nr:GNAT family N-acetyltransferase [Siphonobacter sp. SORGH_AS_0500]MDR6193612.1 GNAT superfamily N-acetyltransferase [Siphonobacter sp. SORGH_AS_0500]
MQYITKTGQAIEQVFDDLAQLRIRVFRDFPYLYEGSIAYEKEYLKTYTQAERSFLFAVYDQDRMIGATTCIPLENEMPEVREPFEQAGMDVSRIFYFGESILLPEYRGHGLGHRFFDEREAHAQSYGTFEMACFCSVVRPEDYPARPADYRPHDVFWKKRGYHQEPALQSKMEWPDLGETESTAKSMIYWIKPIPPTSKLVSH